MLKIEFSTEGYAFNDPYAESDWSRMYFRNLEIKRVLKNVCNQLDNGRMSGSCIDINGNKVGTWSIQEED